MYWNDKMNQIQISNPDKKLLHNSNNNTIQKK